MSRMVDHALGEFSRVIRIRRIERPEIQIDTLNPFARGDVDQVQIGHVHIDEDPLGKVVRLDNRVVADFVGQVNLVAVKFEKRRALRGRKIKAVDRSARGSETPRTRCEKQRARRGVFGPAKIGPTLPGDLDRAQRF